MPAINLLPHELKPKESVLKFSKALKKIALIGFVSYLFLGALMVGAFIIISGRINATLSHQEELKSQVKALQNTEQSLLLTEDRLTKVNQVYDAENANGQVDIATEILGKLPEGVTFEGASLTPDETEVSVAVGASFYLTKFLETLKNDDYKKVELTSFIYKNDVGYEVKLSLVK